MIHFKTSSGWFVWNIYATGWPHGCGITQYVAMEMAEEVGNKGCMGMRWRCPWPGVWIQANQAIQTLWQMKTSLWVQSHTLSSSAFFWEVLTLKIGTGTPPPPLPMNHACVCFILKSLYPPVTTSYCLILFHFPCCTWDFGRLFIGLSIISTQSASAVFLHVNSDGC